MKNKISKMSRRSMALAVAAVLLLSVGTITGTRAALNIQSDYYRAQFYLNHLQVHLIENGKDVCGRAGHTNDLNGGNKITGELATSLGYDHKDGQDEKLGSVEPGMLYKEEIAAQNGSDIDEFVRLTVRKYWMEPKKDDEGNPVLDADGNPVLVRSGSLKPDRIRLYFGGKEGYNSNDWALNSAESTAESNTYYYKTDLSSGETSALLFDKLSIDKEVIDLGEIKTTESKEGNKTIFTYEYQYDGCVFFIEADVQAIQTHNINDAIKSQWGVSNVTATYDDESESGQLTVK